MTLVDLIASNPDVAIAVGTAVAGWLGLTKKKASLSALKDKLLARLRKEVLGLVEQYATLDNARKVLNRAADELLEALDVKRSKAVDAIIEPLIEQALKEYQERLGPVVLRMRIDELFGAVSKLPAAFETPAKPLGLDTPVLGGPEVSVEIMPLDGSEKWSKPFEAK